MSKTLMLFEGVYNLIGREKPRGRPKGDQVAHFMGFDY